MQIEIKYSVLQIYSEHRKWFESEQKKGNEKWFYPETGRLNIYVAHKHSLGLAASVNLYQTQQTPVIVYVDLLKKISDSYKCV